MLLWAGLMGIAGVGAASFAAFNLQETDDEDAPEPEFDIVETGDLFDEIRQVINGSEAAGLPAATYSQHTVAGSSTLDQMDDGSTEDDDDILYAEIGYGTIPDQNGGDQGTYGLDVSYSGAKSDASTNPFALEPEMMIDEDERADGNGSAEADAIITGHGDATPVPADEDKILVGDWISNGQEAEVTDYDAKADSLLLVWDDMADGASEPDVAVQKDMHDDEVMHVMMNGKSVAEVYGDPNLSVGDITLMPLSSALIVDLQAA